MNIKTLLLVCVFVCLFVCLFVLFVDTHTYICKNYLLACITMKRGALILIVLIVDSFSS
jgi:hypothetical protein